MTDAEVNGLYQLALVAGFLGACCWSLFMALASWLADAVCTWEEKQIRIHRARMRYEHGPALFPGMSRLGRAMARRALKARHCAQAAQLRACERLGGLGAHADSNTH